MKTLANNNNETMNAAQVAEREQEYDVKTLPQIAEEVESGNIYYRPTRIKVGSFESFGDFASYFDIHYRPLLECIQNGDEISKEDRHTLNFLASDLLEAMGATEGEDSDEGEEDEDPTLTEAEVTEQREQTQTGLQSAESRRNSTESQKRDTLCRLWDAAWKQAKADPKTYRVIVETNEEDPSANCNPFGRYFMVDGSEAESCIEHAGQWVVIRVDTVTSPYEIHRPNHAAAHGYSDNQTQLACRCENPNNVTRWARLMIDAGRVTDIYADCY